MLASELRCGLAHCLLWLWGVELPELDEESEAKWGSAPPPVSLRAARGASSCILQLATHELAAAAAGGQRAAGALL